MQLLRSTRSAICSPSSMTFARPPESRLLVGALLRARHDLAEESRGTRPAIDFEWLGAALAGLDSRRWQSNVEYTTLLDPRPGVERDEPLPDEE